ncbi:MAG: DoxX family protein [Williamsia sp.]|nr:DoxX family protein [Williamsia sp.]
MVVPSVPQEEWKTGEKILFRLAFIYFFIQCVPLDWKYYREIFSIQWSHLQYGDIFNLAHYAPRFFEGPQQSYLNWLVVLLIAVIGTVIWTIVDRSRTKEYSVLYYWLRVIVRYRLAIGLIAFGIIKLFPVQAPYPSLSNLNTPYGDFTRWKLFSLSLGIVPSYESFLGLVETLFGVLLLYRKTASIGAFLILIFTGNVFMSNLAYEGGESVYCLYLISLALFLLLYDLRRIISLLVLQAPTAPSTFRPLFAAAWLKKARLPLKILLVLFFVGLYGFKTGADYAKEPYRFPVTKGLQGVSGLYNVAVFSRNGDTLAYSKTDPVRWQDVVFEKWNTISIRSNRPVIIDSNNLEKLEPQDAARNYELEGSIGRHYYSYTVDTVNHLLTLHNKSRHYSSETLTLHYTLGKDQLVLSGRDEKQTPVYAVLNRLNKKYLIQEAARQGRRGRLKL